MMNVKVIRSAAIWLILLIRKPREFDVPLNSVILVGNFGFRAAELNPAFNDVRLKVAT
jgi:hypothetical protein